jgi:hypothetical protein
MESWVSGVHLLLESLAAYSFLGGLVATLMRALLGFFVAAETARGGTILSLVGFASVELLYLVNVKLLPGEHYLSWRSLLADMVSVGALAAVLLWISGFMRLRAVLTRRRSEVVLVGVVFFGTAVWSLATIWPSYPNPTGREADGPNLLLIVLDSARRDHFSLYGYDQSTSPSLAALPRARVFQRAYAASSWTVPSVTALLWRDLENMGPPSGSLQGLLAAHGYTTACFTDNPHLARDADLMDGFDVVERSVGAWRRVLRRTVIGDVVERLAPGDDHKLVDKATIWAREIKGPVFLPTSATAGPPRRIVALIPAALLETAPPTTTPALSQKNPTIDRMPTIVTAMPSVPISVGPRIRAAARESRTVRSRDAMSAIPEANAASTSSRRSCGEPCSKAACIQGIRRSHSSVISISTTPVLLLDLGEHSSCEEK